MIEICCRLPQKATHPFAIQNPKSKISQEQSIFSGGFLWEENAFNIFQRCVLAVQRTVHLPGCRARFDFGLDGLKLRRGAIGSLGGL